MMFTLGLSMARLLWTGAFGWFIQQHMRIPLFLATLVLIGLGAYEFVRGVREEENIPASAKKSRAPRVGWLMVLPVLVLISVAPTGLGAAAAERVDAFVPVERDDVFETIDFSQGNVELRVTDFVNRAVWDEDRSLEGETVRLEGLVVNDPDVPDGFLLTRFLVSCCAADGVPVQVAIRDTNLALEDDTWVVADVQWRVPDIPYSELGTIAWNVEADLVSLTVDPDPPTDGYESPYDD